MEKNINDLVHQLFSSPGLLMRIQLSQSISLPLLNCTLRQPLLCVCGAEAGGKEEGVKLEGWAVERGRSGNGDAGGAGG